MPFSRNPEAAGTQAGQPEDDDRSSGGLCCLRRHLCRGRTHARQATDRTRARFSIACLPARSASRRKPVVNAQGSLLFEPEIEEAGAVSGWMHSRARHARRFAASSSKQYFEQAMARGNEGLMIKDLQSPYMPGRRGRWWLKLKRELATLDVVVTAAEFGHGKRIHVLSDYTFAVRKGEELVNIGKAYSGLTDKEIAELTAVVPGAHHGRSRASARGRAEDRAGSGVQCHHALRPPRQRIRAALSADCSRARRQTRQQRSTPSKRWNGFMRGSTGDNLVYVP